MACIGICIGSCLGTMIRRAMDDHAEKRNEQAAMLDAADKGDWTTVSSKISNRHELVHRNLDWERHYVEKGWKVSGETILMKAAFQGKIEIMHQILILKPNVNEIDKRGKTALIHAVVTGNLAAIRLLYENQTNVNHLTPEKENALLIAAQKGRTSAFELLLELGGEIFPREVDEKRWHEKYEPAFNMPENVAALSRYFAKLFTVFNTSTKISRDITLMITDYLNPVPKLRSNVK